MKQARRAIDDIDTIIVVHNERSTHGGAAGQLIARLRGVLPEKHVEVLQLGESTTTNRRQLMSLLQRYQEARPLLVIAGGDGTAHFVTNALLHPDMPAAYRTIPFTPWPLGNGNDFFSSVHGNLATRDPLQALLSAKAHQINVYPLEWHIHTKQHERIKYSLCYGSIGISGNITAQINRQEHRKQRKQAGRVGGILLDVREGTQAIWSPKQFALRMNGKLLEAVEMQFLNGPIMTIRARYPVLLSDQAMFVSTTQPSSLLAIGTTAVRMGLGVPPGKRYTSRLQFVVESNEPIPAQADGESFSLAPHISFSIGPSKKHVAIWATKKA